MDARGHLHGDNRWERAEEGGSSDVTAEESQTKVAAYWDHGEDRSQTWDYPPETQNILFSACSIFGKHNEK